MIIYVGTKNPTKLDAVKEALSGYSLLDPLTILGTDVESGIEEQPKDISITLQGAKNRAKAAYQVGGLGLGIESGITPIPHTKTGYIEQTTVAIYDGLEYHIGISSGFECPPKVIELMDREGLDLSQATRKVGLTTSEDIGAAEGIIGILTKGRVTRKDYTITAIQMAMIHIENKEFYQ